MYEKFQENDFLDNFLKKRKIFIYIVLKSIILESQSVRS